MKIKLFTLIIVLCVCFCNCVLKKNPYKIIDKVLDSDSSIECDSTTVILETSKFDSDFFKNYEKYLLNWHDGFRENDDSAGAFCADANAYD